MTATTWLALAGSCAALSLPSAVDLRAAHLRAAGRLIGTARARPPHPTAARSWRAIAVSAGCVPVGLVLWARGVALAIAAAAALATALTLVGDVRTERRESRRRRDLHTAIRVLAGELAAGAQPGPALAAAAATSAPAKQMLAPAVAASRDGDDVPGGLASGGDPGVRRLAVAWRMSVGTGAGLAESVDRVAADLADADTRRRAVAVALAGPRSSAVLLCGLPLIGIALGAAMGAAPLTFLLDDPAGRAVCCAGVLLDAVGVLWVRRIVRRAAR